MAAPNTRPRPVLPGRHQLVPVGVVVVTYFVAGTLWVLGSEPLADLLAPATAVPRWAVELGLGVLFVAVTTLVLALSMRGRAERLDTAVERTQDADARTDMAEARTSVRTRQLAASENHNRLQTTALSGTSTAVMVTDLDGTIEWVNRAFETLSGYPASEAVGATPQLLRSGVEDEELYRDLWSTVAAGRPWRGELVNRHRDGQLYIVDETITPVLATGGGVQNFVATLEDVTERVRAAQELEASRLRLQSLVDHALDAIVLADDDGRYVEVNPAFCALTGYARDELLGMRVADLAAPGHQPTDPGPQLDGIAHAGTESGTFALRHRDGHVVETEYRAVQGIQHGVHLSVLRDVTERNAMLRALAVAETEFRALAENAADIVAKLRVDDDGRMHVDYVNPAAATILGHPRQQFHDDPDLLLGLLGQRSDGLDDAMDLLPSTAEPVRVLTARVARADGRLVWLEIQSALTDRTTTPVTIQLVARDVTARAEMMEALEQTLQDQLEAAEQLRTLNAMKDTFLQNVSHELRTPLTSIMGFAHLLSDPRHGLSPRDTREYHTRILGNAERLQRLLDDLLDVHRVTQQHVEPSRRPTDLAELVRRTVGEVDLGDHPVDLDLEPLVMDLDGPWVGRIVANLLRNVVRHTPATTAVWIRTRATSDGAEIVVDDDGPGIPERERERVVEPFQQGADAVSSAQPGTGVGLSLVSAFAQLHGGGLAIADSPRGGARMIVTLARPGRDGVPDPVARGAVPPVSSQHAGVPGAPEAAPPESGAETERITAEALRELLQAHTVDQVRGIVLSVVHRLGGWTVPARLADPTTLPVDLSFGIDDPLLPACDPDGPVRASLERHLPRLVEDARRALENLTRTEQLTFNASIDPLTGLFNRRVYERVLPRMRPGDAVVMFDLDGFKAINDTHGHEAGDEVLRSFGATLRSFTRAVDHPCRIGGDEFALLFGATSQADVDGMVDRLRSRWEQRRPWPVGFSAGVALVADDPSTAAIGADRAMYAAKRSAHSSIPSAAATSDESHT